MNKGMGIRRICNRLLLKVCQNFLVQFLLRPWYLLSTLVQIIRLTWSSFANTGELGRFFFFFSVIAEKWVWGSLLNFIVCLYAWLHNCNLHRPYWLSDILWHSYFFYFDYQIKQDKHLQLTLRRYTYSLYLT